MEPAIGGRDAKIFYSLAAARSELAECLPVDRLKNLNGAWMARRISASAVISDYLLNSFVVPADSKARRTNIGSMEITVTSAL